LFHVNASAHASEQSTTLDGDVARAAIRVIKTHHPWMGLNTWQQQNKSSCTSEPQNEEAKEAILRGKKVKLLGADHAGSEHRELRSVVATSQDSAFTTVEDTTKPVMDEFTQQQINKIKGTMRMAI
jgi:DeoR/GlpR family transcriptional regulator of sugar metabolism